MKNTNYFSTFIAVADDCPVTTATIPAPKGGRKTMPLRQYEMIAAHPYEYTQEDVARYAMESREYRALAADPGLMHLKAMRSKRP